MYRSALSILVLCSDKEGHHPDELELLQGDSSDRHQAVENVGSQKDRFRQQAKFAVYLNEPVNEDSAHLPGHLSLHGHVVRIGHRGKLSRISAFVLKRRMPVFELTSNSFM